MNRFMISLVALLIGSLILSFLYELTAGNNKFSLPFLNIILVTVIGCALFPFFGFTSTVIILGVYGLWCAAGGLLERYH